MTVALSLRALMGPEGHGIYSPPLQKKAKFCFVYMRQVNLQLQPGHYRTDSIQLGLQGGQVRACDHKLFPKHQQTSAKHVVSALQQLFKVNLMKRKKREEKELLNTTAVIVTAASCS